ncbi:MAG: hypothetical protein ACI9LY_003431 [Arenicella sp.]|jgi:hypothetical protein
MEIDRKMARYLLEIKRSLPHAKKNQFNLSSPDIEKLVRDVHRATTNIKTKTLAAAFLEQAGRGLEGERQHAKTTAPKQTRKPEEIIKPEQHNASSESVNLAHRNSLAKTALPGPGLDSELKRKAEQNERLMADILPEFLENINISELPALYASSSSHLSLEMKAAKNIETSSSVAIPLTRGTTFLGKVAIFLITPIELSTPITFAKVAIFLTTPIKFAQLVIFFTTPIELTMPFKFVKVGANASN